MDTLETFRLVTFTTIDTARIVVAFKGFEALQFAALPTRRAGPTVGTTKLQSFVAPIRLPFAVVRCFAEKDVRNTLVNWILVGSIRFFVTLCEVRPVAFFVTGEVAFGGNTGITWVIKDHIWCAAAAKCKEHNECSTDRIPHGYTKPR